jgi:hypothetical protein
VASVSGDGVAFNSRAQFAGAVGSGVSGQTQYLARRGSDGAWITQALTPMPRPDALQTFFAATKLQLYSRDLSTAILWGYDLPTASGDAPDRNSIYLEDTASRALQPITVSQQDPPALNDFSSANVWGISDDARHVAFTAGAFPTFTRLLPNAAVRRTNLYQWDDGRLMLAGILPDGTVSPGGSTVYPVGYREAMSADGSRLAFRAPTNGATAQLYQRIDGRRTVWISEPETTAWRDRSDGTLPSSVVLQGVTPDGRTVFFTTDSGLVDSDTNGGPDLYRYTDSADPGIDSNLTQISDDGDTPGDVDGGALIGFAADGQLLYYQTLGSTNIVRWDHGSARVVASGVIRRGSTELQLAAVASGPGFGRVTPDGQYLAFVSDIAFDGVHGLTGEVTNGHYEMYLYSARDGLKCVSCPSGGATADVTITPNVTNGSPQIFNLAVRPRFLSDDGQAFFTTTEALLPEDKNGVADAYEYNGATGDLTLISTGKGGDPANFADASPSGDDVFIVTRQRLRSSDTDDLVDLYDGRVGPGTPGSGGHAPAPCEGEACQPPPSTAPAESSLGSLLIEDSSPALIGPTKALVVRARATFRGGSGALRIRLLTAGRLEWGGRGLRSGSTKRRRAGAVQLAVRLTRGARAQLQANGTYQTTLHVTLVQADGAAVRAVTHVTFRATAKKGR